MEMNSYEISKVIFERNLRLYKRIDDLINLNFDTMDADKLSVLTRTMKDLEESIFLFVKEKRQREMYYE